MWIYRADLQLFDRSLLCESGTEMEVVVVVIDPLSLLEEEKLMVVV